MRQIVLHFFETNVNLFIYLLILDKLIFENNVHEVIIKENKEREF